LICPVIENAIIYFSLLSVDENNLFAQAKKGTAAVVISLYQPYTYKKVLFAAVSESDF
jgi:hypothetical protein